MAPVFAKVMGGTITLGAAISLTGKYRTNGTHTLNGYDLAVKAINVAGGVRVGGKTYRLAINHHDDKSTIALSIYLVERMIERDGIKFMLGPYGSGLTKAVATVTEKYKIPMVEAEGPSRAIFSQGYKYLFAVLSNSGQHLASSIALALEIAKKNGKSASDVTVAVVFENDPFSLDARAGVIEEAKNHGVKIVIDDKLPRDPSDMSATLTKVRAVKPDLLVVSAQSKGVVTVAKLLKDLKIDLPMIAMTHCEVARLIAKFGKASNGFLCPTQWAETLTYKDTLFGTAAEYSALFKKTYEGYKTVPYQAAQASAAVMVWKDALERANAFDIEKIRQALADTNMKTFYGDIKFSPAGNNIAKPMVLRQIQNGEFNAVAPSKWASHSVEWPRKVPGG
ncbi:MAG: amino acid ABC transporter substrate-binding protein [Rhodospirillaceae bacterium]|nr:amino acid ABC transporter substrate-binding protein [Rhodospirillaceae bacterium]